MGTGNIKKKRRDGGIERVTDVTDENMCEIIMRKRCYPE